MVKKKNTIKNIFIFLIVLVILFIIYYFGIRGQISGFSNLAISDVQLIDGGSKIRIFGVANGAEAVQINFNPSTINQYIQDDGYQATKTITGSIGLLSASREFFISRDNSKNYYKIDYESRGLLSSCSNNAPSGTISIGRIGSTTCAYLSSIGTYSYFNGQYQDNTETLFEIGGSVGTISPSSGQNTLTLNDGQTKVEWVGFLSNFQGINTPNQNVLFSNSKYDKLIDSGSISERDNIWVDFENCISVSNVERKSIDSGLDLTGYGGYVFSSNSVAVNCVNNFNNDVNNMLIDRTSNYKNVINSNKVEFSSNSLVVDLNTPTVFPTFIITLDASKVGIVELKGDPDIVSCASSKSVTSGETYSTSVRVKNIGSNDGSFYGTVDCSGISGVSGAVSERFVSKGDTEKINVQVSGTNVVGDSQSNSCKITIIDRKSDNSDTCSFDLDVKFQKNQICEPDSITCLDATTLKTCNNEGTDYETANCNYGCQVLDSGTAQCKDKENNGDNKEDNNTQIQCSNIFEKKVSKTTCGFLKLKCIAGPKFKTTCNLRSWVWIAMGLIVVFILILFSVFKAKLLRGPFK